MNWITFNLDDIEIDMNTQQKTLSIRSKTMYDGLVCKCSQASEYRSPDWTLDLSDIIRKSLDNHHDLLG